MSFNQDPLFNKVIKEAKKPKEDRVFSVGLYLDILNKGLKKTEVKIKGEVSSLKINNRYLFFNLKDKEDGSVLNCFMGRTNYDLSGVDLEVGMEIIIRGYPKVYKPRGSFSFQTQMVELVGEGALKKAYDELKVKLEKEGLFAKENKKPLPIFPKKIGVITSLRSGTVIHDFENNLGKFGFEIKAIDTRVEGKQAVRSILNSIKVMREQDIDILVIMRGGGSLESLQSFDNEALVRAVVDFPKPVLAGIGHHEDVTLVAMVADKMVSTPNATAEILNNSWEQARYKVLLYEKDIFNSYEKTLSKTKENISYFSNNISQKFKKILENFRKLENNFQNVLNKFHYSIENNKIQLTDSKNIIKKGFTRILKEAKDQIKSSFQTIMINDPKRQLNLGYSIISLDGNIIKNVDQVKIGDDIDVKVSNGIIGGKVTKKKSIR